jgi:LDH2 family malate/lactate/ureidoglycolate dehydrogenase
MKSSYHPPAAKQRRIAVEDLEQFFKNVLEKVGVPGEIAAIEAQIGAEVDLFGVHTHGVQLLRHVVKLIREGSLNPHPTIEIVGEFPCSILAEGNRGIGRYSSARGMDLAIERAQRFGVGAVSIRNVGHWGRGHSYALRAARAGFIGFAFSNTIANLPAWGTRVPCVGNNPMAIGIPTGEDEEPVILDMAMSQVAMGWVRHAAAEGRSIPYGCGLDKNGSPTDDPRAIIESRRLLPIGGYKGSGLAFMIEILTGALAGGMLSFEQGTEGRPSDDAGGSCKLFIALRPHGGWLLNRVGMLQSNLKATPTAPEQGEANWPGEKGFRRRADYLKLGIAISPSLAAEMDLLASETSVRPQWKE